MYSEELPIALGAILTGGRARRMGGRKADLVIEGKSLVERVHERIAPLCGEVVCVGGEEYLAHVGVATIPDLYPGANSMGGIATALKYAGEIFGPRAPVLAVACDMPMLDPAVLSLLARSLGDTDDVAVVRTEFGYEPLCAVYRASAFDVFARCIEGGELRIAATFAGLAVRRITTAELAGVDPELTTFLNVNRPDDLEKVRRLMAAHAKA